MFSFFLISASSEADEGDNGSSVEVQAGPGRDTSDTDGATGPEGEGVTRRRPAQDRQPLSLLRLPSVVTP